MALNGIDVGCYADVYSTTIFGNSTSKAPEQKGGKSDVKRPFCISYLSWFHKSCRESFISEPEDPTSH